MSTLVTAGEIERVFAGCFGPHTSHGTQLQGGAQEPLYEPAVDGSPARLWYREDFAASALHEAAHWCVAGPARRRRVDFGYTYSPPPRTAREQAAFFRAELKVQALESLFADAAGLPFRASADNLEADVRDFEQRVLAAKAATQVWLSTSADGRARLFAAALADARRSA